MKQRKQKRKLSKKQKIAKAKRRLEYETIFINGKQKSVKREPMIDGMSVEEFIRENADPIWLMQNGMYEELHQWQLEQDAMDQGEIQSESAFDSEQFDCWDDEVPF